MVSSDLRKAGAAEVQHEARKVAPARALPEFLGKPGYVLENAQKKEPPLPAAFKLITGRRQTE
jgi:hypothetical protein